MKARIGHIGIVVKDAEATVFRLCDVLGVPRPQVTYNQEKNIKFAVIAVGDIGLEIIEDRNEEGTFNTFNQEHGDMVHHICLVTDSIEADIAELEEKGIQMVDRSAAVGLRGKRISFTQSESLDGLTFELSEP